MAALGFLVATAMWPTFSSGSAARWIVLAAGLPLVSRIDPRRIPPAAQAALAIVIGWAALSLLRSPAKFDGALDLFRLTLLVGVMIAAAALPSIDRVMAAVGWGISVSSAICVAQASGFTLGIPSDAQPSGLFMNRDMLAEAAAPVFVWSMFKGGWPIRVLLFVPLALCGSRVAGAAALIGLVVAWRGSWQVKIAILAAIAVGVVGGVVLLGPEKLATAYYRLEIWLASLSAISPFGHGLGWFRSVHPYWEYAHSDALQAVVEFGVVPVLLGVAVYVALGGGRGSWGLRDRPNYSASSTSRAAGAASLVTLMASFSLHEPVSGFVAAVLAGDLCRAVPRHGVVGAYSRAEDERHLWEANAA